MKTLVCCNKEHDFYKIYLSNIYDAFEECRNCWALISILGTERISALFNSPKKIQEVIINGTKYRLIEFDSKKHLHKYKIKTDPEWALNQLKK